MSNIFQPGGGATVLISDTQTLSANNTTANVPIFGLTGTVEVLRIWGVVTTAIGANHTGGLLRLNDQTAQVSITTSGATLSAATAGTAIYKSGLSAAALTVSTNAAGRVSEPTTLETTYFSPFIIMKKTGAATNIEYRYATTDAPTSGVIQFFCEYRPLSADGALAAL